MSRCLNEARIRAAADGEATEIEQRHVEGCAECSARVTAADGAGREFAAMVSQVEPPANLTTRVARALAADHPRAGATTLRDFPSPRWGGRVLATAGLVAAAVLAVVFLLPPLDAPRTLSAAQILDRSLRTMTPASGTERREFDLELRLPRVVANHAGTYRIEQLVDHDAPGRYRIVRYSPDGTVLSAISEEPAEGRRTAVVRRRTDVRLSIHDRSRPATWPARARTGPRRSSDPPAAGGSRPDGHEVDTGRGRRYVVELPQVADTGARDSGS